MAWPAAVALLALVVACGGRGATPAPAAAPPPSSQAARAAGGAAGAGGLTPATDARLRIVILGDSLTAGLGLPSLDLAYPARLQQLVSAAGYHYEVVNAGVSGDTTAGGLSRLDWVLEGHVRILVVALGGNDGLRGIPVSDMEHNLAAIIQTAQQRGIQVLLAGMEAPPNYGPVYTRQFHQAFRDLARRYHVAFLPFLLQGVAGIARLNQADGIHPTAQGAQMVADNVWQVLKPLLAREQRAGVR
ncbi:MAG TPA: arylesterase [Vicinamibacterales bacterium]|nr:arylesterase [Vicinamibacterales bacterium]